MGIYESIVVLSLHSSYNTFASSILAGTDCPVMHPDHAMNRCRAEGAKGRVCENVALVIDDGNAIDDAPRRPRNPAGAVNINIDGRNSPRTVTNEALSTDVVEEVRIVRKPKRAAQLGLLKRSRFAFLVASLLLLVAVAAWSEGEERKVRSRRAPRPQLTWGQEPLTFYKQLGKGKSATVYEVSFTRAAAGGRQAPHWALREEEIKDPLMTVEGDSWDTLAARLNNHRKCSWSPYVAPVIAWNVLRRGKTNYLQTAYPLADGTVQDLLDKNTGKLKSKYAPYAKLWTMELAAAYSYCHSPEAMVTHLDAHSRNILYVNDGGRIRLWLTDFGLSKGYTDPHDQRFINDKYTDIHAVGEFYFQLVYGKVGKRGVDEKLRSKRLCQKDEDYFRREKLYRGAACGTNLRDTLDKAEYTWFHKLFQGGTSTTHPVWSTDLLKLSGGTHPFAATKGDTLLKKNLDGDGALILRQDAMDQFADQMLPVKAHVTGKRFAPLEPYSSHICDVCGDRRLYDEAAFMVHSHEPMPGRPGKFTKKVIDAPPKKVVYQRLSKDQKRIADAIAPAIRISTPTLLFTERVTTCDHVGEDGAALWADVMLHSVNNEKDEIKRRCKVAWHGKCNDAIHLGELVDLYRRHTRREPWTSFFTYMKEYVSDPGTSELARHFAAMGVPAWVDCTRADIADVVEA